MPLLPMGVAIAAIVSSIKVGMILQDSVPVKTGTMPPTIADG
jgi:hypothetical protein